MTREKMVESRQVQAWYRHSLPAVQAAHDNLQLAINAPNPRAVLYATSFEAPPPPPGVDSDGKSVSITQFSLFKCTRVIFNSEQRHRSSSRGNGIVGAGTLAHDPNAGSSLYFNSGIPEGGVQPRTNAVHPLRSLFAYLNPRPTANPIPKFLQLDPLHSPNFRRGLLVTLLGWFGAESHPHVSYIDSILFYTIDHGDAISKASFGLGTLYEAVYFEVNIPTKSSRDHNSSNNGPFMSYGAGYPGMINMESIRDRHQEQASFQSEKWTVFVLVEKPHPGTPGDTLRSHRVDMSAVNLDENFILPFQALNLGRSSQRANKGLETPWHLIAFPSRCINTSRIGFETWQPSPRQEPFSLNANPTGQPYQYTTGFNSSLAYQPPNPGPATFWSHEPTQQGPHSHQRAPPVMDPGSSAAYLQPDSASFPVMHEYQFPPSQPQSSFAVQQPSVPTTSRFMTYQHAPGQQQSRPRRHQHSASTPASTFAFPAPPSRARVAPPQQQTKEWLTRNIRMNTKGRMPLMEGSGIREEFWRDWMEGCRSGEVGVAWWENGQKSHVG